MAKKTIVITGEKEAIEKLLKTNSQFMKVYGLKVVDKNKKEEKE